MADLLRLLVTGWAVAGGVMVVLWLNQRRTGNAGIAFVTGIPPTEAHAVASRGEDYRAYQRTTSPFVPWLPRDDPGLAEEGG